MDDENYQNSCYIHIKFDTHKILIELFAHASYLFSPKRMFNSF